MERFRLRVLNQPQKGLIWELKLFPDHPGYAFREKDGRIMGSSSVPATILWLRQISTPYLKNAVAPGPIDGEAFGPKSEPRWLEWEDGLRLSLAFANARYLRSPRQKKLFKEGIFNLPSEVVLYWFTLCFYGYRQAGGKAALRTLLTYGADDEDQSKATKKKNIKIEDRSATLPTLFPEAEDTTKGLNVRELADYYTGEDISRGEQKQEKKAAKDKNAKHRTKKGKGRAK